MTSDPHSGSKHVPYRNSLLTMVLRDSLGKLSASVVRPLQSSQSTQAAFTKAWNLNPKYTSNIHSHQQGQKMIVDY